MTTFNLKNQNRRTVRYGLTLLGLVVIIVIAILITKPTLLDHIKLTENSTIKRNHNTDEKNTSSVLSANLNENLDSNEYIIIKTKSGKIRGKRSKQMGVNLNTFLGIRYGKAPTKRLRFRKTVAVSEWSDTWNATRLPPACIQSAYTQKLYPVKILNYEMSEDCLFLNIWAPNNVELKLPVIVWIHGGMFTIGSIGVDEYDGSVLAAFGNVIVVSIQYRLGIFGFLDLDSDSIPGNMGLWDQSIAIKWVHENIDNFGGDPNMITLMGQSAGAISIGLHMMSPVTKKLFKRVILQSGSDMLLNQIYSRGDIVAETFVQKIGCLKEGMDIFESNDLVVNCIDKVPFDKIVEVQQEMVTDNPVPFLPTIPNDYVEYFPNEDNGNQTYEQKEFLVGFNINEGNLILHLSYPEKYKRDSVPKITTLEEARNAITNMAIDGGFPQSQSKSMASVLLQGNSSDSPENWARKIGSVFGDIMFICPTMKFADKFANLNRNVYMYVFNQKAFNSVWGNWLGVTHHDEIDFMFGVALRYPNKFHGDDIDLSKRMMKTWAQFAKTGSVESKNYDYEWPLYNSHNKTYMELNAKNANIGHRFHEQSCNLYDALVEYLN